MSLVLDLPAELEANLAAEAARLGLSLPEHVLRLLAAGRVAGPGPRTGTELLTYWEDEGLVGTRTDITDAQAHARVLREQGQKRGQP
jgi:hypothetical protein